MAFPLIFETSRLTARPWNIATDLAAVIRMYSDPEVVRFIGSTRITTPEAARDYRQFRIDHTRGGRRSDDPAVRSEVERLFDAMLYDNPLRF